MALLPLTNDDKARLKRLAEQKDTIFSLKKLFINRTAETPASYEVQFLAAQKIAECLIEDIFHDLEVIQPDNQTGIEKDNLV